MVSVTTDRKVVESVNDHATVCLVDWMINSSVRRKEKEKWHQAVEKGGTIQPSASAEYSHFFCSLHELASSLPAHR